MSDIEKLHISSTGAGDKEKSKFVRDFSKVIITLENIIIPDENLKTTPSMVDGLMYETEMDLRILGCELIQTAGILLKLSQVAMATGEVLFQRFYYSKSFVKHGMEVVAMACINLASKIEEVPRRIRDVVNVFHHIKQFRQKKTISPLILDQNYINLKNQVIKSERRVLKELGFCVHVKHPHKIIVMYLQVLEAERNQRLLQCAWNYMNDSFRTNVFVRFNPETIACACIYLTARQLQIPLPNNPQWFLLFGIKEQDIRQVCMSILRLYTRNKPNADELERDVGEIKKQHIEAKLKAKEVAIQGATPIHASATATPEKFCISPSISGKKKIDSEKSEPSADRKELGQVMKHKRSRSRSQSRSFVKKMRSDDSGEHQSQSYNSSSRSRSRSPRSKPRQQHNRHYSKKDEYYSRQKTKYDDKHASRDFKKRKSSNNGRSESNMGSDPAQSKYAKYLHENKKDNYQNVDTKSEEKYQKRPKYSREDLSPQHHRAYSSSPDRISSKKRSKHKNKVVSKSPENRNESKKRNGQSRVAHSNHHHMHR